MHHFCFKSVSKTCGMKCGRDAARAHNPAMNQTAKAISFASNQILSHPLPLWMAHLVMPSSCKANPGPTVEEPRNIIQPSSLESVPRAGILVPLSNSFELDPTSGTSDNIPRDEDAEPITTISAYYGALSKIGPTSSRTHKSSSSSNWSMLLGPLFGTHNLTICELVQYLQSKDSLLETDILDMRIYYSKSLINHKFVVLQLNHDHGECWLRLDCWVTDPFNASFIYSSMQGPAKDEVYDILFSWLHTGADTE